MYNSYVNGFHSLTVDLIVGGRPKVRLGSSTGVLATFISLSYILKK